MEAKKLTNNCYLISDGFGNRLGLGMVRKDGILFTYDTEFYDTLEAIAKSLNEPLRITELETLEESIKEIEGYPIKHDLVHSHEWNEPLQSVVYKVREQSNVQFCAGWWAITTDSICRLTLSPKITTLGNDSVGPFKNRFDAKAEVARINQKRKDSG